MSYIILIIVGVVGIWLGYKFALQRRGLIAEQSKRKAENKEKILEFLRRNGKIQNNDVEKLYHKGTSCFINKTKSTGVSDATAERYLDELEKEGKLTQHGEIGQGVFYTLK